MCDNVIDGQEAMVLVRLFDELNLVTPGARDWLDHLMLDSDAEWREFLDERTK